MGKKQDRVTEIRNYLNRIANLLNVFMKQEGEKGADWLWWVSGPGSDLLLMAAEMCQLVDILKSKPLKSLSGLYVLSPRTIDAEPPRLSLAWGRTKKHRPGGVPATKGKANSVREACREEEEGKGRAQAPRATDIHTRALPLLNWLFTAWHCAHPSIKVITTKTHSEWEALEEAHLLRAEWAWSKWVQHIHNHTDPGDAILIPSPEEASSDRGHRILFTGSSPYL